ncbi:hypothetical protein ACFJIY_14855 [Pimelobacter simplex]|uniref:hypothetical protein n=1 Tax=Nocardioides simplex TaxID=2045 RepID=UPI00366FA764
MRAGRRGAVLGAAVVLAGALLVLRPASPDQRATEPASRFGPYAGHEVIEVWACRIPLTTHARVYQPSPLRIAIDPARIAGLLDEPVRRYFDALSNGRYQPRFVAGGVVRMDDGGGPRACLRAALDRSAASATAVLVVADAEHRADAHGGLGTPGEICATAPRPCPARVSGRGAYVGGSDFHPDWGPVPALDLVEHELGHTLGWPHSFGSAGQYDSALDVMSDSAAPRAVRPEQRDAGGTLGINRLAAGWIPAGDVRVAPADGTGSTYVLRPSASASGTRLLVLPLGPRRAITVELLVPEGVDAHLPEAGIALTSVDASAAACGVPCDPLRRRQRELHGRPPFTDLLQATEPAWVGDGWQVRVDEVRDGAAVVTVRQVGDPAR